MSIELTTHQQDRSARYQALRDVSLAIHDGELVALLGPSRLGQDDAAADHRRAGHARITTRGRGFASTKRTSRNRPAAERARGLRVPALRPVPAHERVRERGVRPAGAAAEDCGRQQARD